MNKPENVERTDETANTGKFAEAFQWNGAWNDFQKQGLSRCHVTKNDGTICGTAPHRKTRGYEGMRSTPITWGSL